MFHFRQKATGTVYGVLIDISSGSVGVGIVVSKPENKLPILLYTHRSPVRITEHSVRKDESLRRIREALFSAALVVSQEGTAALTAYDPHARINRIFVTCASPWSFTIARDVHYENDEPFKITKAVLDDLVESAEQEIFRHVTEESNLGAEGFEIVERATVDLTINGYPVHEPLGLKGTELSLSHIAGLIPRDILTALKEVEDKLFPHTEIRPHTYMLIMYCVLRDIFPRTHTHCIIDVTGEATEFGIVENNLLIENTYTDYGAHTLVREIMQESGKPASDISTSLIHFEKPEVQDDPTFKNSIDRFIEKIVAVVNDISSRRAFPDDVIITAHVPHQELFQNLITTALRNARGKEAQVLAIDPKLINELSQSKSEDVYLAICARFFHKLHGCGE